MTIIDRRNHHLFQPLLYQVATAGLSPADIAAPIRSVLRYQRNCTTLMAEVVDVDLAGRTVRFADATTVAYDALIVAGGVTHSYFGHPEWQVWAPGLKTLEDAIEIRRRLLLAFELAENTTDPAQQASYLTFVIIGGGPTGVELAGALAEMTRYTLARDFRRIDPRAARIVLVEAGPRLLAAFDQTLSNKARGYLEGLAVTVRLSAAVTDINPGGITLADGTAIATRTAVWAASVAANPLGRALGLPDACYDRAGRVRVEPDLSVPGHPEVYVAGDLAAIVNLANSQPVPGVAQGAIQMGHHAAANILRRLAGQSPLAFRYYDKGNMAIVGQGKAIAEVGGRHIAGPVAWLMWAFVHIFFWIGFRNQIVVMTQWIWQYLTCQVGARLITQTEPAPLASLSPVSGAGTVIAPLSPRAALADPRP